MLQRDADTPAELGGAGQPGAGQQQRELVAAETRDEPGVADDIAQARPELGEQAVARVVAERVVELLEAVEVDHRHRERRITLAQRGVQALVEQAPVGEARELVGQRERVRRVQRSVLDEGQRHPPEHAHERGGGEPDRRVDGLVEVVEHQQAAGDEREQRGRDERAPALQRDEARSLDRAPGGGRHQQRRHQPDHRDPQGAPLVRQAGGHVAGVSDDLGHERRGEQDPDRTHAPAAERERDDHHHDQQHIAHRIGERQHRVPAAAGGVGRPSRRAAG